MPYFKISEGNQHQPFVDYESGKYHNASGPMKVNFYGNGDDGMNKYRKILLDAAAQSGIPIIKDINANQVLGYLKKMQGTHFNGRRESSAKAFLVPAKNRPNLHVIKHAFVEKILINPKNEAYGVEFEYNEQHKMRAIAGKEIILSAGAFMSPVLLQLSGIGPKEVLKEFNIPVKSDLPVGKNLIDHHGLYVWFKFNPTEDPSMQQLDNIYNLAIHNTGPLTSRCTSTVNGFVNTVDGKGLPDFQVYSYYHKRNSSTYDAYTKGISQALTRENQNHDLLSVVLSEMHPKSKGYVKLRSSSPHDKPIINPRFYTEKYDVEATVRALKQQISFVETPSYRKHGGQFIHIPIKECDQFEFRSDDYFRCYIKYLGCGNNHPVGTSKMGSDSDPEAVVDSRLRVRNIKKLRQIDAGV